MAEERSSKPSERRRQEARGQGLAPRSAVLTAGVGFLAAAVFLRLRGAAWAAEWVRLLRRTAAEPPRAGSLLDWTRDVVWESAQGVGECLGVVFAAMVIAHQIQVGGLFVPSLAMPDLGRLWRGRFDEEQVAATPSAWGRVGWSTLKTILILAFVGIVLARSWSALHQRPERFPLGWIMEVVAGLAILLVGLGAIDYFLQHRRIEVMLRPSPEQEREERRAHEGSGPFWARARRRQHRV